MKGSGLLNPNNQMPAYTSKLLSNRHRKPHLDKDAEEQHSRLRKIVGRILVGFHFIRSNDQQADVHRKLKKQVFIDIMLKTFTKQ